MNLTFSSAIESSDGERRIIAGKIVPFGSVGNTSAGPVVFERGSIQIPNTAKIKLLMQHEPNNPIGRAQNFQTTNDGIYASFKISSSSKGTDALLLASEDLVSGLSVGVEVIASKPVNGHLLVTAARLIEVSLVESPAFTEAIVTRVAAQEGDSMDMMEEDLEAKEDELINQISTAVDGLKLVQELERSLENTENQTQTESEAIVDSTTAAVSPEAATVAAVEASRPTLTTPYITSTVRSPINSMGSYALHKIKAEALHDEDSALYVRAADDFTGNPAFNPQQYLREFVSNTNFARPAVDACSRGALPASGMTINIPSLITTAPNSNDAPTVALTAEGASPSDTSMTSAYISKNISKYAGQQTISLELIERGDPNFMAELMVQLERAYLKATDQAVIATLISDGATAAAVAGTNAGLISYVSTEAANIYKNTSYFARNIVAGTGQWSAIMGYTDTTGRSIYNASNPWNNNGQANVGSIRGNVLGLDLYVDHNVVSTIADNSAFIIAPEAVTVYESAQAYFSVNVVNTMSVNLAIYGYMAAIVKQGYGVSSFVLD